MLGSVVLNSTLFTAADSNITPRKCTLVSRAISSKVHSDYCHVRLEVHTLYS